MKKTEITNIKEYWVGFSNAPYWGARLFKKGYQHVYVLYKSGGKWIEINPRSHALEVFVLPYSGEKKLPQRLASNGGHPFIRMKIEQKMKQHPLRNLLKTLHCTNMAKYIVGVRMWAYTPYQLYKRLATMPVHIMKKKGILEIEVL